MKIMNLKQYGIKHIIVLFLVFVFTIATSSFFLESLPFVQATPLIEEKVLEFEGTYDWEPDLVDVDDFPIVSADYITYSVYRDTVCKISSTESECNVKTSGKSIRFDTAEELYRFSVDVSLEEIYITGNSTEDHKLSSVTGTDLIGVILNQDYVLGGNIDYSIMQSKAFVPIGFAFTDIAENVYERSFSGTFDGQGFEINNLYVAGYNHLIYEDEVEGLPIEIALSAYYSMFNYNEGTIKNLGLIDANLEILELHTDITKLSNLVGFNMSGGIVQNVYVVDDRTSVTEAGMRYQVGTSSGDFEAAGIVHTNQGTFTDSYYVSPVVMNGNYINKFDVQPVLFQNSGTIARLAFDTDVYLELVTVGSSTFIIDTPNGLATEETTIMLLNGEIPDPENPGEVLDSVLKDGLWYFYEDDCYPLLQGFEYVSGAYEINNPIDFAFFARVIQFDTVANGSVYSAADYEITANIDMITLSPTVYVTPSDTFTGTLSGYNSAGVNLGDNFYIYNLHIDQNLQEGSEYYSGLFSILGADSEISNLNFNQSSFTYTDTDDNYSNTFYIGAIAGKMTAGKISNVLVDVDIDMGTEALGKTYAGGIVGKASGIIEYTSYTGTITSGTHTFASAYSIKAEYNIGGIVGGAELATLTLEDVVNHGTIYGLGTPSNITLATGYTQVEVRIGGIIGYINNSTNFINELINVANHGDIYVSAVTNSTTPAKQYVGGVFGKLDGLAPILESSSEYKFANLYNAGDVYHTYAANTSNVMVAGIGVNNASEAIEYALLFNYGTFDYTEGDATHAQTQFDYVSLIYDVSSNDVTISRAYNYTDYIYDSDVYHDISGLYYSVNDNDTLLRYVANYGDISYMSSSGTTQITAGTDINISGITLSANVDYLNVYNYGNITVVNVNLGSNHLYISGIAELLSAGNYMKNSLNDGDIIFAELSGTGIIFVAGLVITNYSGDLDDEGQSETQPIATIGIINTINSGNITTSYTASLYGVDGTNNTFVGGLVTLNRGSIQDCANLGDISVFNSYTSGNFSYDSSWPYYTAGMVTSYTAGIVSGGVSAIVLNQDSRIYDTANNGDVNVKAYKYARAGGVLGVALYEEALAGGITSGMGLETNTGDSILSNGLNFGNVSAITENIGSYSISTASSTSDYMWILDPPDDYIYYNFSTTVGTNDRPPIHASAGGVIGYGLSTMQRMLNHGTISSTDVAGGVVGATFAKGDQVRTTVKITTAVNYGEIKSIDAADYNLISGYNLNTTTIETNYYMTDGNSFIFPAGMEIERPRGKRGFGGIFGRIQRGNSGYMNNDVSSGGYFEFIVNANPNIDLIGRLDQVYDFSSSTRFYQFSGATCYSAKLNDTTQAVFTGFYWSDNNYITAVEYQGYTGTSPSYTHTYQITYGAETFHQQGYGYTDTDIYSDLVVFDDVSTTSSTALPGTSYTVGDYYGSDSYEYQGPVSVPWITEDPLDANITPTNIDNEYMYDEDFEMRTNPDLTEYIYFMPNELLAIDFSTARPNGMYVLSTSAGQSFGSVIPKNIDISYIRMINEDYEDPISGLEFISLLMDYTVVSPAMKLSLHTTIETSFDSLKQTNFNDKSDLIPSDTVLVTVTETGGSSNVLNIPTIDYINNTITYTISMEAFSDSTASFAVTNALTSSYSLIAIRSNDYCSGVCTTTQLEALRDDLYSERGNGISTAFPADLTVTLPSSTITDDTQLSVGYFTVYSEAFVGDDLYATPVYYTDFEVRIIFTPKIASILTGSLDIETVEFNGGAAVNVSNSSDITALGTVNSTGSVTLNFEDTKGVLIEDYDFKDYFVVKYNDDTIVDSVYYSVTSTPVYFISTTGYFDITFTFLTGIVAGDYYFEYQYFPNSSTYTCAFDKGGSGESEILDFTYDSENDSLSIVGLVITSYVNIGTTIDMDLSPATNFSSSTLTGLPSYMSNVIYDFDDDGMFTSLEISPFASVTSARLVQVTYSVGYKTYQMEYIIEAEDGTSSSTYIHNLIERTVDLESVLKDENDVLLDDIHAAREAIETVFTIDLGFDQNLDLYIVDPGEYAYIGVTVSGTTLDEVTTYTSGEIVGITYSVDDYLIITMSYSTLPGIYTFDFVYYRDGPLNEYVTFTTSVVINKDFGTDAYLTDIFFSELANETTYPDINIVDEFGVLETSSYSPAVYFEGIDYDGSDDAGYPYFKIDGKVSNVPLDSYVPFFLNYLPYGATISRKDTVLGWTAEVDSSSEDISSLAADYALEGTDVVMEFRVTAEDSLTAVYYFITVTDVTYNLSIVFDIYYCTDATQGSCTLAQDSVDFNAELIVITVKNLDTDIEPEASGVPDPDDYPTFSVVNGLNNKMTQFYFTTSGDYTFKFGRNMGGFYTFQVELPLDEYLNDLYGYTIVYDIYDLYDASTYNTIPGLQGKYYYIEHAITNRTRRFNVYIWEITSPSTEAPWGLFDFFKSWFEE